MVAGDSKPLHELRQEVKDEIEDGTLVLADIPDAEKKRLMDQLLEHRETKRRGVRGTNMSALVDARQTAKSISSAVRPHFSFPLVSYDS
jgi:hypothetical protein